MKKLLCMILAAAFALCGAALAQVESEYAFPAAGMTIHIPEELRGPGNMYVMGGKEAIPESGVYLTNLSYFAMTDERFKEIMDLDVNDLSEEEYYALQDELDAANFHFMTVLGLKEGVPFDEAAEALELGVSQEDTLEMGKHGDITYYGIFTETDKVPEGEYGEVYTKLTQNLQSVVDGFECYDIANPLEALIGKTVHFETVDTEGNPVNTEELFKSHEYTMVNIWTSWCPFCKAELPDLEEINGRIAEKDCAIIGLLWDGQKAKKLAVAKEAMEEGGVTFPVLIAPENAGEYFDTSSGYPTSYFVNREGKIVGLPIIGADIPEYEPRFEALLKGEQ